LATVLLIASANSRAPEGLYKRSLAIREEKLGRDHPDVAQTLSNLGILYRNQGKYAEAEAHYKRAPGDL
jgi:tetratricopeptide (TPR) repeat protein